MALPRIDTPTYQIKLPSTGQIINYRPFLVKEQKIIMMAQETEDEEQMLRAMSDLVTSCTFNQVDVNNLPMYDVEYLFLRIRGKSVGETVDLNLICPDDGKTKAPTKLNLEDVRVNTTDGHNPIIDITDTMQLYLRHPIFADAHLVGGDDSTESMFRLLNRCIVKLVYNDEEIQRIDMSEKDISEFIDQMSGEQFERIINFFNTMPRLKHTVEVVNPKTKVKSEVVLEGLQSFLG